MRKSVVIGIAVGVVVALGVAVVVASASIAGNSHNPNTAPQDTTKRNVVPPNSNTKPQDENGLVVSSTLEETPTPEPTNEPEPTPPIVPPNETVGGGGGTVGNPNANPNEGRIPNTPKPSASASSGPVRLPR